MVRIEDESLNRSDGTRKWHRRVLASEGDNGLRLWLGDLDLRKRVRGIPYKNPSPAEEGFYNTRQYSTGHIARNNEGFEYYHQDPDTGKITHRETLCGSEWIGIARSSPATPSGKWSDWTHVMHWAPDWWMAQDVPKPEEVIDTI